MAGNGLKINPASPSPPPTHPNLPGHSLCCTDKETLVPEDLSQIISIMFFLMLSAYVSTLC